MFNKPSVTQNKLRFSRIKDYKNFKFFVVIAWKDQVEISSPVGDGSDSLAGETCNIDMFF